MSENFLNIIKEAIKKIVPEAHIILYGSRARHDHNSASDWDFLILLKEKPDIRKVAAIRDVLYDIELETGEIITIIIRDIDDWNSTLYKTTGFYKNVMEDAIVI
ncbi:MAG: nucleotidyltransferase domain-containing protein [Candidatus Eremiobacterota bacterium]